MHVVPGVPTRGTWWFMDGTGLTEVELEAEEAGGVLVLCSCSGTNGPELDNTIACRLVSVAGYLRTSM